MTWTSDKIAIVKRYWGDKTARQIGDLIDKSKNAVLGKAQRLGLSGEPNTCGLALNDPNRQRTGPQARPPINRRPVNGNSTDGCQWLYGEPRERNFCGRSRKPGSSYCDEHHARCWINPANYRSEAA